MSFHLLLFINFTSVLFQLFSIFFSPLLYHQLFYYVVSLLVRKITYNNYIQLMGIFFWNVLFSWIHLPLHVLCFNHLVKDFHFVIIFMIIYFLFQMYLYDYSFFYFEILLIFYLLIIFLLVIVFLNFYPCFYMFKCQWYFLKLIVRYFQDIYILILIHYKLFIIWSS